MLGEDRRTLFDLAFKDQPLPNLSCTSAPVTDHGGKAQAMKGVPFACETVMHLRAAGRVSAAAGKKATGGEKKKNPAGVGVKPAQRWLQISALRLIKKSATLSVDCFLGFFLLSCSIKEKL